MWAALDSLREQERVVVYLRYFLNLPERELAEYLGCAQGTVKSRLHRSLRKLREVVARRYPELLAEIELMQDRREEIDRLEYDIQLLSQAMAFPTTPSLPPACAHASRRSATARTAAPSWQLALTAAAAAFVGLAFLAGVLAPARDAVADLFDSINIFETDEVPADLTRDISGTPISLEAAEATLGRPILLPTYPEELAPERVLLQDFGQVKAAVLFFEHPDGTRFALFETNAGVGKGLPTVGKGIADEAQAAAGLRPRRARRTGSPACASSSTTTSRATLSRTPSARPTSTRSSGAKTATSSGSRATCRKRKRSDRELAAVNREDRPVPSAEFHRSIRA